MKRKLIIVSASSRILKDPKEPISALERYDGIYFRVLKKYLREGKLRNVDIFIVSKKFGVIKSTEKIPYYERYAGKIGAIGLDKKEIDKLKERNLKVLKSLIHQGGYSEIYVNVGSEYYKLISGFESFTKCIITHATGRGPGPKALHMKSWLLSQKDH